jgi:S1-C subfamily serine protease
MAPTGFTPHPLVQTSSVRKTNGMAIAAFICGVAGIPLLGLITGAAAVVLACVALGDIRRKRQRGIWLAGSGLALGIFDVVGWIFLIWHVFFHGGMPTGISIHDFKADLSSMKKLPVETRRALSANVVIMVHAGLLSEGIGSGIVLDVRDGEALILTNRHVIDPSFAGDGAERIGKEDSTVKFVDEAVAKARIVWIAPNKVDLALVKAPCRSSEVQAALWAAGRQVQVGDPVFAVGNPHGLAWTHTQGAVSQMRWKEDDGRRIHVVQTSAAINPGNSGGGLYDAKGYLIGVATWTNDKRVSEGISFAIGFDSFLELVPEQLLPAPGRKP